MSSPRTDKLRGSVLEPGEFHYIQTQTGWQRTLQSFANWCAPAAGSRVLDAGCGPGIFPAMLTSMGCRAFGVDLDPLSFLPQPLHQDLAVADAARPPFPDGCFDLVTASNLLFLLPNPVEILRELARLVHSMGQIALLNPSEYLSVRSAKSLADQRHLDERARESLLSWAGLAEKHARWDQASLEQLFERAGLRLVETNLHIGPGLARFARGMHSLT